MSQSERALLCLDNTGSYWIIRFNRDNNASTFVVDRTGPNIDVEDLFGTHCDILHSEKLQELEARPFEKAWYITDPQAFETACDIACSHRLRGKAPFDQDHNKKDWITKDIEFVGTLDKTVRVASSEIPGSMSKKPRDDLLESSLWSEKRHPENNASALGRGDTYRPNYDHHRPNALSSAKTKQNAEHSTLRRRSTSPGRDMHNGVVTSKYDNRLDKPRRPMQQLRQMNSSATGGSPSRPREISNAGLKRLNGDRKTQNHAGPGGINNDFSGVPRGPKHQYRPRRQNHTAQQKAYETAVDEKSPDVIQYKDLPRLKERPHIFISSSYLPFMRHIIPHLHKFFKKDFNNFSVKAEVNGYYIFSSDDVFGRKELQRCYELTNMSTLFGEYTLHMELRIDGGVPPKRPLNNDERVFQKTGAPSERSESRFENLPLPVDGPSASHLRAKADDEISITPSEISSATTRAKTHCAECKSNHFPSYNAKIACRTCPRHYHAKCGKPQPRPNEDLATWQCNYCFKKGRPKPRPAQQNTQTEGSGRTMLVPAPPEDNTQDVRKQPTGQLRMGVPARNLDGAAQATRNVASEPSTGKSSNSQREILDPRLRNRMIINDPRLRDRAAGTNGLVAATEVHKHSSSTHPTQEHNYDVERSRKTGVLRDMQFHPDTQIDRGGSSPRVHSKHHTANAVVANPRSSSHAGLSTFEDVEKSAAFEKVQAPRETAEGDAEHAVSWDIQQADLQPEIPDLSLDIAEVDRTEISNDKAVPVVSNDSQELIEYSPEAPKSPQGTKHNSRSRCSMCGKTLFSRLGIAEEATCARCKKEQIGEEDGSSVHPSSVTAEEIWRRRLQPEKYHANGVASPTESASQDAEAPQFKSEHSLAKEPQGDLEADASRQPALADDSSSLQSIAESESAGCGGGMSDISERGCESIASPIQVERQEDAATPETVPRGPSAEANGLEERRSWSPVNKPINNDDDAGMESDNALSAIGSEGARDSRSDAVSGERPNVGRKVANATEPSAKLPGCFSWPDLIGFALAEASDHRMTAAQVHQWIANNVENYDINNTTQRSSIAATLSQQKVKFPKAEPIMEGARHLSRWKISPDWVLEFKANLETEREKLHKKSFQAGRSSSTQRRKEFHDAPKGARAAANTYISKHAHAQKESSKLSTHTEETPMFIKRHRVAYDADGRDIVAGFKDVPIEKWTQLAEVDSFRRHGLRFHVGDFIKAPLPNRFRFADYTHKPLVQTMAQIEEIRQRRDGPGYAILVQWFLTREAADWWKCRQVKSLWPKDERSGIYVPATVWDILTSDFVAEQEKLDAEEVKHLIIPTLFFDLDTDKWRLYLKEGRGPETGIAFGPRSLDEEDSGAEDTAPGLNRLEESPSGHSHQTEHLQNHDAATETQVTLRTKLTMDPDESEIPRQQSPSNSLGSSHLVFSRKAGSSASLESPRTGISISQSEPDSVRNAELERQLFTPSPTDAPMVETADEREHRMADGKSQGRRSAPTPITERPAKRQKTENTSEEQAAIRAIIQMDRDSAKHDIRDLWAAAPEYDPANDLWDRDAKIAEIKARPSRKARFSKNLAYARRDRPPNALYMEVDRPDPNGYKGPPPNRPGSGYSNASPAKRSRVDSARFNLGVDDAWNSDFNDTNMPDAPTQATTVGGTPAGIGEASNAENDDLDSEKPEMFDTLEELLGLPPNFVPTLYEGRLAFRDGTMGLDGRMPRAKKIFKVGRNVPGELK